MKGTKGGDVV